MILSAEKPHQTRLLSRVLIFPNYVYEELKYSILLLTIESKVKKYYKYKVLIDVAYGDVLALRTGKTYHSYFSSKT